MIRRFICFIVLGISIAAMSSAQPPGARQRGGPRGAGPGAPVGGARGDESFVQRLNTLDEDQDGGLSRKELPEHMQQYFESSDTDKDGRLRGEEIRTLASHFGRDRLAPGGEGPAADRTGPPGRGAPRGGPVRGGPERGGPVARRALSAVALSAVALSAVALCAVARGQCEAARAVRVVDRVERRRRRLTSCREPYHSMPTATEDSIKKNCKSSPRRWSHEEARAVVARVPVDAVPAGHVPAGHVPAGHVPADAVPGGSVPEDPQVEFIELMEEGSFAFASLKELLEGRRSPEGQLAEVENLQVAMFNAKVLIPLIELSDTAKQHYGGDERKARDEKKKSIIEAIRMTLEVERQVIAGDNVSALQTLQAMQDHQQAAHLIFQ